MTRKKNVYTAEFKTQAISLVKDACRPAAEVARELGINTNTLYNWLSTSK
jgi:transposase